MFNRSVDLLMQFDPIRSSHFLFTPVAKLKWCSSELNAKRLLGIVVGNLVFLNVSLF
jgi:hypothetical protein